MTEGGFSCIEGVLLPFTGQYLKEELRVLTLYSGLPFHYGSRKLITGQGKVAGDFFNRPPAAISPLLSFCLLTGFLLFTFFLHPFSPRRLPWGPLLLSEFDRHAVEHSQNYP